MTWYSFDPTELASVFCDYVHKHVSQAVHMLWNITHGKLQLIAPYCYKLLLIVFLLYQYMCVSESS